MAPRIKIEKFDPTYLKHLLPLFFIIFIDTVAYFIIIPVLLRLFMHGPMSILPANTSMATRDMLYSVTIMLSPLAFIICSPIGGYFSDRYGRKKTMLFFLLAAIIGFLLPIVGIVKKSVAYILIGRFIAGASTSSQPIAQAAIADFTEGSRKAIYLGLIGLAMTLGMVLGPLAGGFLSDPSIVSWFNTTTPYFLGVILAIANIFLLLTFFNDPREITNNTVRAQHGNKLKLLRSVVMNNYAWLFLVIFLFLELAWSQYYQAMFLFMSQKFHYSASVISIYAAYIGIWMSLGLTVVYRNVIRVMDVDKIAYYSLIIATLGLVGCNYVGNSSLQWFFIIPTAVCTGTTYPSILATLSNRTTAEHQGLILGTASTVLGFAWMVTAFTTGLLIHIYLLLPIIAATILMLIACLIILNTRKRYISAQK